MSTCRRWSLKSSSQGRFPYSRAPMRVAALRARLTGPCWTCRMSLESIVSHCSALGRRAKIDAYNKPFSRPGCNYSLLSTLKKRPPYSYRIVYLKLYPLIRLRVVPQYFLFAGRFSSEIMNM
ncbi:hypothetical protein V5799_030530 [Amblyomma americanum]|uniref:Uncharacterized protein n=1 Tax=Amblyomma americanum TaxID=6943 RepID=A0AAQ4EN09_AMBAM